MRAELIVIFVCLGLMVTAAVFCYICLVVASDADRVEEEQIKKKLCVKEVFLPDGKGGWETTTPIPPECLDSENNAAKDYIPSESARRLLEKKAGEKNEHQD